MNYFIIVFGAFFAVLCGYLWILIDANETLLKENSQIKIMLESQKVQHTQKKIDYLERVEKAKNESLNRLILNTEFCQSELDSYKALIRAM